MDPAPLLSHDLLINNLCKKSTSDAVLTSTQTSRNLSEFVNVIQPETIASYRTQGLKLDYRRPPSLIITVKTQEEFYRVSKHEYYISKMDQNGTENWPKKGLERMTELSVSYLVWTF